MYRLYFNDFDGLYLGCEFKNGTSITDNENIVKYFKRHNLKFEEIKEEKEQKESNKTKTAKSSKTKKND